MHTIHWISWCQTITPSAETSSALWTHGKLCLYFRLFRPVQKCFDGAGNRTHRRAKCRRRRRPLVCAANQYCFHT
ncbi:hypothetical protein Y032_0001g427 [Ancylostoma ceylanicum]|nr:hypothetical protein Y032_0001g427 [Ancylostoma ceylanicum]